MKRISTLAFAIMILGMTACSANNKPATKTDDSTVAGKATKETNVNNQNEGKEKGMNVTETLAPSSWRQSMLPHRFSKRCTTR